MQLDGVLELLEVCMKTTYFQLRNKFYQQKDGTAIGSLLPPIVRSIFMEYFETLALDKTGFKPTI
jgi:hypothetical protein